MEQPRAEVGEVELMWAIHSLWAPPTETDNQGRYSLNGRDWIKAGVPIHTAETREEAEQWQAERKQG